MRTNSNSRTNSTSGSRRSVPSSGPGRPRTYTFNSREITRIQNLRAKGYGAQAIATQTGLPLNGVTRVLRTGS